MTTYRHRVFGDRHLRRMEEILPAVCADVEAESVACHGEANHVHLLVDRPPTAALSKLVGSLTGVSSRHRRQEVPDLVRRYRRA